MVIRFFILLLLTACGQGSETSSSPSQRPAEKDIEPISASPSPEEASVTLGESEELPGADEARPARLKPAKREQRYGAPIMGDSSAHREREIDPDQLRSQVPDIQAAMALIEDKDFTQANELLKRALENHPKDPDAHYWMGRAEEAQGEHEAAVQWMLKATELDPDFASAWWGVGLNYAIRRNCESALEAQSRYIELRPEDPGGYYNRAGCRWYTKDREGSLIDGRRACEMGHAMACRHVEKQLSRQPLVEALEEARAERQAAPASSNSAPSPAPTAQ